MTDSTDKSTPPEWYSIGDRAFYQCRKLQKIKFSKTIEIGKEAFFGCVTLQNTLVNPAIHIGEGTFTDTLLAKHLDNKLSVVGNFIVSGINCVGDIIIPDGIKGISPYAFAGNRRVNKVLFPESLLWIGEGAFFDAAICNHISQNNYTQLRHMPLKNVALSKKYTVLPMKLEKQHLLDALRLFGHSSHK